jgi:hypothetical protein
MNHAFGQRWASARSKHAGVNNGVCVALITRFSDDAVCEFFGCQLEADIGGACSIPFAIPNNGATRDVLVAGLGLADGPAENLFSRFDSNARDGQQSFSRQHLL